MEMLQLNRRLDGEGKGEDCFLAGREVRELTGKTVFVAH